jgi:hypothetical protein
MSPTIYGVGSGLYNKLSIQIPTLIRSALKAGRGTSNALGADSPKA